MMKCWAAIGVVVLLVIFSIVALACIPFPGRMTGGGSVFIGTETNVKVEVNGGTETRVTHGFEIHCGEAETGSFPSVPNNLEINWPSTSGPQNRFHLDDLVYGLCTMDTNIGGPKQPPANFNTFEGKGYGSFNGVPGAYIEFVFTDSGEPGIPDTEKVTIWDSYTPPSVFGNIVLQYNTTSLTYGNQQAHKDNNNN